MQPVVWIRTFSRFVPHRTTYCSRARCSSCFTPWQWEATMEITTYWFWNKMKKKDWKMSSEYSNIPKALFTPHHILRCWALFSSSTTVSQTHCCSTMSSNTDLRSFLHQHCLRSHCWGTMGTNSGSSLSPLLSRMTDVPSHYFPTMEPTPVGLCGSHLKSSFLCHVGITECSKRRNTVLDNTRIAYCACQVIQIFPAVLKSNRVDRQTEKPAYKAFFSTSTAWRTHIFT